jgi:predicted Ser/Thr protein kinase
MTIKFSEFITQKEIDGMYLMTIINPIRRQEIRRLLEEMRLLDYQN